MCFISSFFRLFLLYLLLVFPLALIGWLIGGFTVGLATGSITTLGLSVLIIRLERIFLKLFKIQEEPWAGLAHSIQWASKEMKIPQPFVFSSPCPDAIIVRTFFSSGTLLISQGLLRLLSEEELRAVLAHCTQRCQNPNLPIQSLSLILATLTLKAAPIKLTQAFLMGNTHSSRLTGFSRFDFLKFLLTFPLAQVFILLSGSSQKITLPNENFDSAMRKIRKAALFYRINNGLPALESLALSPSSHLRLVSLF